MSDSASEEQLAALRRKLAQSPHDMPSSTPPAPTHTDSPASEEQLAALRRKVLRIDVVTVTAAAKHVNRSPATLRKWRQRGKLTDHGHDESNHALVNLFEVEDLAWYGREAWLSAIGKPPTMVVAPESESGTSLLTAEQAAELVGVAASTVRSWASRGYTTAEGKRLKLEPTGLADDGRTKLYDEDTIRAIASITSRRAGRDRPMSPDLKDALARAHAECTPTTGRNSQDLTEPK